MMLTNHDDDDVGWMMISADSIVEMMKQRRKFEGERVMEDLQEEELGEAGMR